MAPWKYWQSRIRRSQSAMISVNLLIISGLCFVNHVDFIGNSFYLFLNLHKIMNFFAII